MARTLVPHRHAQSSVRSWPPLTLAVTLIASLALLIGVDSAALQPSADAAVPAPASETQDRPNVVFITTDDQRADDMAYMPFTRRLLGRNGVTFDNALSPHPLCCPARAEFVSGQYGQNNGVHHNVGSLGGYQALKDKANTLGRWLYDGGYQTAMVGKYLNGYRPDEESVQGWTHWNPSVAAVYAYTGTVFHNDGNRIRHDEHVDDVVTSYAAQYIREFAENDAPFFVWASDLAPHMGIKGNRSFPPVAAPRHRTMFAGATSPSLEAPSFGRRVVDGPAATYGLKGLFDVINKKHRSRIRSLQAVDEGVRDIVRTLQATGEWDNTYVVFTSDNGFLLGEHGLVSKNYIFEEALRVPMIVKVPGRTTGLTSTVPVSIVDIAPTIAALTGVAPQREVDGVSFAPLLTDTEAAWRDTQLIQTGSAQTDTAEPGWELRGVRTDRYTYARDVRDGSEQLYDRQNDPFQTVNVAGRVEYQAILAELQRRTAILKECAGEGCDRTFGPVPEPAPLPTLVQVPSQVTPVTVRLSPSVTRTGPEKPVRLTVTSSKAIRSAAWQRATTSGGWRTFASGEAAGRKATTRVTSLRKPGKQRFRVVVTLVAGNVVSRPVVVTTRPEPERVTRRAAG